MSAYALLELNGLEVSVFHALKEESSITSLRIVNALVIQNGMASLVLKLTDAPMEKNGMFSHLNANVQLDLSGMELIVTGRLFAQEAKSQLAIMSVYALMVCISIMGIVNQLDAQGDRYSKMEDASVKRDLIGMGSYVYSVSMARNGTQIQETVFVLLAKDGMEISVRKLLFVQEEEFISRIWISVCANREVIGMELSVK